MEADGESRDTRKRAVGRKPKSDLARQVDRTWCKAWALAVAAERGVRPTGYALTKLFDSDASAEKTEKWAVHRSKTWDKRLAGNLGMPRERELDRISPVGTRSRWLVTHVIAEAARLTCPTVSEVENLLRQLDPRVSLAILSGRQQYNDWTNDYDRVIRAAERISKESNLDALAALLMLAKITPTSWNDEDCIYFAMLAYGVFLRVVAIEKLHPVAEELYVSLFDRAAWDHDWKPSRSDRGFHPWLPEPDDINIAKAARENSLIIDHIAPRLYSRPSRIQKERVIYFSDIASYRRKIIQAAEAIATDTDTGRFDKIIAELKRQIDFDNPGKGYDYELAWWMSGWSLWD